MTRQRFMNDPRLYDPGFTEADPRFGNIQGIPVGTKFASRFGTKALGSKKLVRECSAKGVHPAVVAGISGNIKDGAYSIVLSGGYEDDIDDGDFFYYTGTEIEVDFVAGGQGNAYAGGGKQVEDQTFNHKDNAALKRSEETGRPVRVTRGFELKSKFAPTQGYRYDGLYIVEKAYLAKGPHGYDICRYELRFLSTVALATALHLQASTLALAQTSAPAELVPPPLPSPKPPVEFDLTLQRDASAVKGLSIPHVGRGFWGFSIEMSAISDLLGKNSTLLNVPFLNLLANLQERAGGVLIRIGGPSQETAAMVDSIPDGANTILSKDTNHTTQTPPLLYTRDVFYMAGNISSKTDVKWFFGIPFNQTSWRLTIAEEAENILGDNLAGLQAGNEPDLYERTGLRPVGYSPASYTNEVGDLLKAIDADARIPVKNNLVGPSITSAAWSPEQVWQTGFIDKFKSRLRALTVQKYPTNNCAAQFGTGHPVDPQSVLPDFLTHKGIVELVSPYEGTQTLAQGANLPLMMFETNTASCGGFPGISDSYTAALWAIDYGLQLAQANFTNGLLQAGAQGTFYNPFTAPPSNQSSSGWTVGPVYYSALVLAEAFGKTNTSRIVDLSENPNTPAYAVYEKDALNKVALINYMDDPSGSSDLKTFGNSSQSDGRFKGDLDVKTITCDIQGKECIVPVPAPGFALVFFDTATPDIDIGQATQTFATTQGAKATSVATDKPTSKGFSDVKSVNIGGILTISVVLTAMLSARL
ncbi:hypothetical protein D9619_008683 [Psilocybe cf. subviscida]|uniref:YDG domain-containing protein n=1 Tax=Psilocybe cf. subviscida TaxID=2480587 RepID=A0A8H5BAB9_9AGAR|nr:hypothetical protein D9619_008683 [Psilocybe cf. subviscida]